MTKNSGQLAGGIRSLDLSAGEQTLLRRYSLDKGVGSNGGASQRSVRFYKRRGSCTNVQAVPAVSELEQLVVGAMYEHGMLSGGVHSDTAVFGHISEREYVADRIGAVPYRDGDVGKTGEVTEFGGGKGAGLSL